MGSNKQNHLRNKITTEAWINRLTAVRGGGVGGCMEKGEGINKIYLHINIIYLYI